MDDKQVPTHATVDTPRATPKKLADDNGSAYWAATLRLLGSILFVWVLVSFGASIVFAGWLNRFNLGGYPLGFWFAQQGSMYIYIILICVYTWRMNKIDRKFDVHEE